MKTNYDVSIIVCTLNNENTIRSVLESIISNFPKEIIVVDGKSTDRTVEISKNYTELIFYDEGSGIAQARNVGLDYASGDFIMYVGPDNIMPLDSIFEMKNYLIQNNWVMVGAIQRIKNAKLNYLSWSIDHRFTKRFIEGETNVVGTPNLYISSILKKYKFNPSATWSDDSEIANRFYINGFKFGLSNVIAYEIGTTNLKQIFYRWVNYGKSDYEVFKANSSNWSLSRRMHSILYPFKNEFLKLIINPNIYEAVMIVPFATLITIIRYYGWIRTIIKNF
jgi:glycosyltransferase involved in cell wall biosynthesis